MMNLLSGDQLGAIMPPVPASATSSSLPLPSDRQRYKL